MCVNLNDKMDAPKTNIINLEIPQIYNTLKKTFIRMRTVSTKP